MREHGCVRMRSPSTVKCESVKYCPTHVVYSCTRSTRASLNNDGSLLIAANLLTGFDLYSLETGDLIRAFGHDVGEKRMTPVIFLESGTVILGGTTVGEMHLWDVSTGRKLQTLVHAGQHQ